jgi:hypothetical protein
MAKCLRQARDAGRMAEFPTESKCLISLKRVRPVTPSSVRQVGLVSTKRHRAVGVGSVPQVGWGFVSTKQRESLASFPARAPGGALFFVWRWQLTSGTSHAADRYFLSLFWRRCGASSMPSLALPASYSVVIGDHHGANGPSPLGSGGVADRAAISNLRHCRRHDDSLGRIRIHLAHVVMRPRERGDSPQ